MHIISYLLQFETICMYIREDSSDWYNRILLATLAPQMYLLTNYIDTILYVNKAN